MADPGLALVHADGVVTHAELRSAVARLAGGLLTHVGRGGRFAVWLPNGLELIVAIQAGLAAGVVPAPIHHGTAWPEVEAILRQVRPAALITSRALALPHAAALSACVDPVYFDLDALHGPEARVAAPDPLAPALILHTSGTHGHPRAVVLSRAAVDDTVRCRVAVTGMGRGSVSVMASCLSQSVGLYQSLAMLDAGGAVVVLESYDVDAMVEAVHRHRPTHLIAVVEAFDRLLHHPAITPGSLSCLTFASVGADRVTARVADRFVALTGRPLRVSYGLTESSWALVNPGDRPDKALAIGLPAAGAEVRVVEGGRDVEPGRIGQILVRSPRTMLGYLDDPAATRAALRDGWLATGDLGWRDDDGYFWFAGREKDLIVLASGDNVSPIEVERVLASHEAVATCAVAGVDDGGSVVPWAWVTATGEAPSEEALRAWLRERLSDYKVPRRIVVVDALPVGLTGKVRITADGTRSPRTSRPGPAGSRRRTPG